MKKTLSVSMCLLLFLTALYPIGVGITACFGYHFALISIPAFAIVIAALSILITALAAICEDPFSKRWERILLAILTPLSMVNALLYILVCPHILIIVSVLLCAGCFCYLTIKYEKPAVLKIISLSLFAVMIVPVTFSSCMGLFFGEIKQDTVVQTIPSPSGERYAQVISSDQGALGGDTFVDVYKKSNLNIVLFKIEKGPQRVYCGEWYEFESIQVLWQDDTHLIINSVAYEIQ